MVGGVVGRSVCDLLCGWFYDLVCGLLCNNIDVSRSDVHVPSISSVE
jgi:hypothetical protein